MQQPSQRETRKNGSNLQTERLTTSLSSPPKADPLSSVTPTSTEKTKSPTEALTWVNLSDKSSNIPQTQIQPASQTSSLSSAQNVLRYPPENVATTSNPQTVQPPIPHITLASLIRPDQHTEELLTTISIEQFLSLERTIQRAKKKKAKEQKKIINSNNTNITNNTGVLFGSNNLLPHRTVSPSPNVSTMITKPISNPQLIKKKTINSITSSSSSSSSSSPSSAQTNVNNDNSSTSNINVETTQNQDQHEKLPEHHEHPDIQQQQEHPQNLLPILTQSLQPKQQKSPKLQDQLTKHQIPSPSPNQQQSLGALKQPEPLISNPSPNHALPATDPIIETREGVQFVVFTYSVKGNNKEYRIRIDVDHVNLNDISEEFKNDNCLYPRANCSEDKYQGNRWAYENECNILGWKLAWLNSADISGKRGLLQRAVDSYRNRDPNMRSRRVVRNEKILNGTLRKRAARDGDAFDGNADLNLSVKRQRGAAKQLSIDSVVKGVSTRVRVRADIESVNMTDIPDEFRKKNCVYPRAFCDRNNYKGTNWDLENWCNELGWKLAYLNSTKLGEKKLLLQKALDMYRAKYTSDYRPRRGKYSHTLSAKFFENHPREVSSTTPMNLDSNSDVMDLDNPSRKEDLVNVIKSSSSSPQANTSFDQSNPKSASQTSTPQI
ncbi:hypothetical protein G9A89_012618 [Geosiphon pyriformis]|nr:hypothetical protein G9A89_012618 [Geosiphon pyriformis]